MLDLIDNQLRAQNIPLAIELWDGKILQGQGPASAWVRVRSPQALLTLAQPTLGKLAETYVKQQIDLEGETRTIISLAEHLCNAAEVIHKKHGGLLYRWWLHTRTRDRKAISYHYDVSNEFFSLWLDARKVYSCAYFKSKTDTLDRAQEHKLEHICRKLCLTEGERFLDIGCGWGALIFHAVEHYDVKAVGITLSQNQYDYVQQQIQLRGLQGRCEVRLMDYRDVPKTERYDKIASVGMFEHVGAKNLQLYFAKIYALLKPGGLVLNHGITASDTNSKGNGLGSGIGDFISKYVFPGGQLVHVSQVISAMAKQKLECWDAECLRPHYAKTLWHWVSRLEQGSERARQLIGEEKYRVWQIYMAGSAHAFERNWLSIFQLLGAKPLQDGSVPYPLTRDHVYHWSKDQPKN